MNAQSLITRPTSPPDVSVVVPVFDEEGAVETLAREIATAFAIPCSANAFS